ncbi:MAG: glycosyltransferase family 9 protein [Alphaproteobacteria bacterium]|nr:glycosyltransferase family 9 protein [Alphaproteobacteria bacterium]
MSNLFILPTFLGDMILTTGVIDKYRHEPATIIATPLTAPLFADLPHLERLIIIKKKPWKKHWLEMWSETHKISWNNVIDFKSAAFPLLLKANKRYGWAHTTDKVHKVHQITQFMMAQEPLSPTLWFSEERLARVKPERPVFAVAPVPGWKGKQWPIENFVTLLTTFCKTYPDAQVAVFCAPSERELVQPLLDSLPKDQCINTIGNDLLDSAALIQSSRLCIANDSGLMHLSAAVKTPTIALFGPSNENIYGPWSDQNPSPHRTVRGSPFTGNVRQLKENTKCYMTDLAVSPVWEVVKERWETLGG